MSRTALQTYGTQQVMTSSPAKLIFLLYDKAIACLREAMQAIEEGQIERRWQANRKATEIITHLANTLDHENGGEIAVNLDQLYEFMLGRLLDVDLKNEAQAAEDVIQLLQPLRDAWQQLAKEPAAQQPVAGGQPQSATPPTTAAGGTGGPDKGQGDSPARQPINLSA